MSAREDTRSEPPMSEVPFYKTRMGRRFYESTMPDLVEQLKRLNEVLERLVSRSSFLSTG